jgi:hypothetical protein
VESRFAQAFAPPGVHGRAGRPAHLHVSGFRTDVTWNLSRFVMDLARVEIGHEKMAVFPWIMKEGKK